MKSPSNPNPNKRNSKKNNEFEFCKVCKLNHNLGRRHNYLPNHVKSLSAFLSRFQSKISDVRFFIKNPSLLRPELASQNRFWCVFCDSDVTEPGSSFACERAINHLASADHLKNFKSFMWKYGGKMDRVDIFRVSDTDLAKYQKKCISMKSEDGNEQPGGALIGPSNDIHNELKFDYVDSFDRRHNFNFPNGVLPLQNHTNEKYQVSHSDMSRGAASSSSSFDRKSLLLASDTKRLNNLGGNAGMNGLTGGYHHKGLVYSEKSEFDMEGSSAGLQKLTQISSKVSDTGNVHSGAPPPWFDATNGVHFDPVVKTVKSKLNPNRVGAAWAEKRKLEMELESKGKLPVKSFDANWLPNFGRVWQSGTRKDSRKQFEEEVKKLPEEIQSDSSLQLQPYISKRMRREDNG
ncbi:TITAN-like protein isoform X2 [Rutidosis leptorrhynchoides]|uniref:TITAN-like protein isoform X2 n=1 Tax=Rutidosis leptorrhynchoides TaxID=125765 RepID=UPI003A9A2781